jgi:hypothetical protein
MRALLVDQGRDRATLVAVRALTAAGFEVGTGAPTASFASLSRHAGPHHLIRECAEDEDGFVADIARAVGERSYDIVFCSYEGGLLTLSRRRQEIAPAVWPYPSYEVVRRTFDKLDLFEAATAAGVPTPYTVPADEASLARWSGRPGTTCRTASTRPCSTARSRRGVSSSRRWPKVANRFCRRRSAAPWAQR